MFADPSVGEFAKITGQCKKIKKVNKRKDAITKRAFYKHK